MTEEYSKKLCMKELCVSRNSFVNSHFYDTGGRRANSAFIFVVRGELELAMLNERRRFSAGTLVYIPEGSRYSSFWSGTPEIEFFTLHIINNHPETGESYGLQAVDGLDPAETAARVTEIFELMATGGRVERVRAIGLYYGLYADVLPRLAVSPPVKYNPALLAAVDYIDAHYAEDFGIDDLAAVCHISASRLSHLFRSELGTTPVRLRGEIRLEHASAMLRAGELPIADIAERCGFNSIVYFDKAFKSVTGFTPGEYRSLTNR